MRDAQSYMFRTIAYEIICQIVLTMISRFLSTYGWRFFFILCKTIPTRFSTWLLLSWICSPLIVNSAKSVALLAVMSSHSARRSSNSTCLAAQNRAHNLETTWDPAAPMSPARSWSARELTSLFYYVVSIWSSAGRHAQRFVSFLLGHWLAQLPDEWQTWTITQTHFQSCQWDFPHSYFRSLYWAIVWALLVHYATASPEFRAEDHN